MSGAALLQENTGKVQQYNDTYFPTCTYIGSAYVSLNKDSGLRLELTLQNTKVILDDFYIYYDQNEEMQNYLVEWNKALCRRPSMKYMFGKKWMTRRVWAGLRRRTTVRRQKSVLCGTS